jgi:hypothetical protein
MSCASGTLKVPRFRRKRGVKRSADGVFPLFHAPTEDTTPSISAALDCHPFTYKEEFLKAEH